MSNKLSQTSLIFVQRFDISNNTHVPVLSPRCSFPAWAIIIILPAAKFLNLSVSRCYLLHQKIDFPDMELLKVEPD